VKQDDCECCDRLYHDLRGAEGEVYDLRLRITELEAQLAKEREQSKARLKDFDKVFTASEDGEMIRDCCSKLKYTLQCGDSVYILSYALADRLEMELG